MARGRGTSTQLVLELPRSSEAPGIARRWLAESFAEELDSVEQGKAKLLVSELVTNAVVHGRGRIEIYAQLDRDRLLVEVIDEGAEFAPPPRRHDLDIAGGLGLSIVDEAAGRWGIRDGAAAVWFELPQGPRSDFDASGGNRPGQPSPRRTSAPTAPQSRHGLRHRRDVEIRGAGSWLVGQLRRAR